MDEAVRTPQKPVLLAAWLWLAGLCAGAAGAQTLNDPLRPPAAAMAAPIGAAPAAGRAPNEPQLQSVLISRRPGGRQLAVIDGQTVRLGEKFKDEVLVKVSETEVVLRHGSVQHTLKLFPRLEASAPQSARH